MHLNLEVFYLFYIIIFCRKGSYLHYKNSFIHPVHKANYGYDEHSHIFWKFFLHKL